MGVRTETKRIAVCDVCSQDLPTDRTARAALVVIEIHKSGHNGDEYDLRRSLDLCLPCTDKALPGWRRKLS